MQTFEAILKRKSIRSFKSTQISERDLNLILDAACAAPVGHGDYNSLRLTVIQNRELLNKISSVISDSDMFYGAQTVIVISSNATEPLNYSNAGCISENILLAATDLEIGSVYVMYLVRAFEKDKSLLKELKIPNEFFPVASVALGYSKEKVEFKKEFIKNIKINKI